MIFLHLNKDLRLDIEKQIPLPETILTALLISIDLNAELLVRLKTGDLVV
ncbi:MAG: hypothetical protein RLZZ135_2272 [Cyanobacteriota bacterium]|jgi:hypothetical protein